MTELGKIFILAILVSFGGGAVLAVLNGQPIEGICTACIGILAALATAATNWRVK